MHTRTPNKTVERLREHVQVTALTLASIPVMLCIMIATAIETWAQTCASPLDKDPSSAI